jgi:hypothetical protein
MQTTDKLIKVAGTATILFPEWMGKAPVLITSFFEGDNMNFKLKIYLS